MQKNGLVEDVNIYIRKGYRKGFCPRLKGTDKPGENTQVRISKDKMLAILSISMGM